MDLAQPELRVLGLAHSQPGLLKAKREESHLLEEQFCPRNPFLREKELNWLGQNWSEKKQGPISGGFQEAKSQKQPGVGLGERGKKARQRRGGEGGSPKEKLVVAKCQGFRYFLVPERDQRRVPSGILHF